MSNNQIHRIQLVGLVNKDKKYSLIRLGLIVIEDDYQVFYNSSIVGFSRLRWTWHQDGKFTTKDGEKILQNHPKQRLDSLEGHHQFLMETHPINAPELKMDYRHIDTSQIFFVDFLGYEDKHFGISIHLSDESHFLEACKIFSDKPKHQVFTYVNSHPYLVVHFFKNG